MAFTWGGAHCYPHSSTQAHRGLARAYTPRGLITLTKEELKEELKEASEL